MGLISFMICSTCTFAITTILSIIYYNQDKLILLSGPKIPEQFKRYKTILLDDKNIPIEIIYIDNKSDIDLIFLPGKCVNEDEIYDNCRRFSDVTNANIFALLYSGVNNNYKKPTEANITKDLECLSNHLNKRQTKKIIFGFSFGSAPAVRLASTVIETCSLFLMNPFTDLPSAVANYIKIPIIKHFISSKWENCSYFAKIDASCYFLVSELDLTIPPSHSAILMLKAKNSQKISVNGAGHNDIWTDYNFALYVKPLLLEVCKNIRINKK